ncbi:MAG: type VII toxin-antitoxin system HepT family RNase toxin [Desulfohalobiaceae bacterium]
MVERNLEVAAQCCIDICHRIIALKKAKKPVDSHEAILRIGELHILDAAFARRLAPIAGFRNVLLEIWQASSMKWSSKTR